MKTFQFLLACLVLLAAAGCASTPTSRVAKNKALYSQWPADVQEKVAAGKIMVGFTPEQVRLALGEPSRTFIRTTHDGTAETWAYRENPARFNIGLGLASSGGSTGVSGRINVSNAGYRAGERTHVIFEGGRGSVTETAIRSGG